VEDLERALVACYPEIGKAKIELIVKEADKNKDGVISLEEFIQMASKHEELKITGRGFWGRLFLIK